MKYLVCYFSATGNTERAVRIMAEKLIAHGDSVEELKIVKGIASPDVARYDRLIAAFPVLAFAPPVFVKKFLRRLPRGVRADGSTVEAAVLAVDAGGGMSAASVASKILMRRGYDVVRSGRAGYVENWVQFFQAPEVRTVARATENGDAMAKAFAEGLSRGERAYYTVPDAWWAPVLAFLFGAIGRRFLGKLYYADEDCNACGICSRSCPAQAIILQKNRRARLFWKFSCEDCNRCINTCPKGAIVTSIGRIITLLAVAIAASWAGIWAYRTFGSPVLANVGTGVGVRFLIDFFAITAIIFLAHFAFGPFDRYFLRYIQRVPGVRRFFAWTFTKGWRRYMAPAFRQTHASRSSSS